MAQEMTTFEEQGAMEYTIIVAKTTNSLATLQYLVPYRGAALVEYFMYGGWEFTFSLSLLKSRPSRRRS